jgi:uncharacterized protein (UPF0276 family)
VEETGRAYGTLFLLPPIQTPDSAAVAARSIASMNALLRVPIAFETGANYLHRQPGEMSDGALFAAVAEAADCASSWICQSLVQREKWSTTGF